MDLALQIDTAAIVTLHLGRLKDFGQLLPEHLSLLSSVRAAMDVAR